VEKEVSYVEYRIYFFEIEFSTRAGHFLSERESILQPTYYKKEEEKSLKKVGENVARELYFSYLCIVGERKKRNGQLNILIQQNNEHKCYEYQTL
jgi:hypothetical protein